MRAYVLTMTRRALRHHILMLMEERWRESGGRRDQPTSIWMHPESLNHVLMDSDPREQYSITTDLWPEYRHRLATRLMGIPLQGDLEMTIGEVEVFWPEVKR